MGTKYRLEHPNEPYDLTDVKGIAAELADEAVDDAKVIASDVAETVTDTVTDLAEEAADEANAAIQYPRAYAGYTWRRLERRAREKPLDTLAAAATVAFLAGALWGVVRR